VSFKIGSKTSPSDPTSDPEVGPCSFRANDLARATDKGLKRGSRDPRDDHDDERRRSSTKRVCSEHYFQVSGGQALEASPLPTDRLVLAPSNIRSN